MERVRRIGKDLLKTLALKYTYIHVFQVTALSGANFYQSLNIQLSKIMVNF